MTHCWYIKKPLLLLLLIIVVNTVLAQGVIIAKSEVIESRNGRNYYVHNVLRGQTVYSISRAYEVTPEEIYFENPGSKNGITINQKLYIPTVNKQTELTNEVRDTNFDFFYHVAANNETFADIAAIYIIPERYVRKANPNMSPPFKEGEYVKVPVEEAFDILDGKVKKEELTELNIPIYRPQVNNSNSQRPNNRNTTTTTRQNPPKQKPVETNKKVNNPVPSNNSEFVSFNPDIPVIQDYRHVVILGETTQSIAKKYDISVELLKAANPGLGNTVVKGDRLRVPDKSKLKTQADSTQPKEVPVITIETPITFQDTTPKNKPENQEYETIQHVVKKKQTLYSIGREYGLTVDELIGANPGLTSNINVGQVISVPKKKINLPYLIHRTNSPTKTNKLAKLYGISSYQIYDFNPELGKRILSGEDVKIPVGSKAIIVPLDPTEEYKEIVVDENEPITPVVIPADCNFEADRQRVFKIALLIPFELEEADSLDREQFLRSPQKFFKPFRFIQFYEGALFAVDSLTKEGMNIELFVYDVDKNLSKTAKVLNEPELRSVDLIIGPFYSNSFKQVALFAGNFNIPIINPLTYRDEVVEKYKTVIKVKPTVYSQQAMLETFIKNYGPDSKVFLISQTSYADADLVTNIKNGILNNIPTQVKISNNDLMKLSYDVARRDTLYVEDSIPPAFILEKTEIYPEIIQTNIFDSTIINNQLVKINYSVDSLHPFIENASPIRNNLVVLYGRKKSFILDVLNKLNETRDTFDVQLVGMPIWERISNLSNHKMNNLRVSYFSSSYIDFDLNNNQDFIYEFRNRYGTEPDNYAYSGFDITYYFLSALFYLGDDFNNCPDKFPMELTQGTYNFSRIGNGNNFINDYWHVLQLRRMKLWKLPDYKVIPDTGEYYYE